MNINFFFGLTKGISIECYLKGKGQTDGRTAEVVIHVCVDILVWETYLNIKFLITEVNCKPVYGPAHKFNAETI